MPSNLEKLIVDTLGERGNAPLGDIYKSLNANRKNAKGETLKQVIARMIKSGVLTSTIVKNGKRGRPQQLAGLNRNHKNFNPATPVESEEQRINPQGT
jgi:predicted transcriptional regulator